MSRSTIQNLLTLVLALAFGASSAAWHSHRRPATTTQPAPATPAGPVGRTLDPEFVTAVQTEFGAKRWLRLVAASEQATAAEMPALLRLAGEDSAAIRILAARWAELDPRHMFQSLYAEYLLPDGAPNALPSRWTLGDVLFETWVKKDAAAVLKALNEVPNFSGLQNLRMNVVNQLMKTDPGQAIQAMQDWRVNNYLPDMKEFAKWAAEDPRAATTAALKLGQDHTSQYALKEVGKAWAKTNPREALEHAATLKPTARTALGSEVMRHWAGRDLEAAIEFATSEQNATQRAALGQSLVATWGKTDPAAALEWSQENLRGAARAEAIGALIKSAAEKDISQAAELAAGMEAGPAQIRATTAIFETWFKNKDQRSAALDWLAALPDEEARRSAFERVQWNWSWQNPDEARDFLSGPHGKLAPPDMVSQIARTQAAKNPAAAMEWAAKLPENQILPARTAVLQRWLSSRPEAAQDFARKLPAGAERDAAVRNISQSLSYESPQRTAAWYHSLPAADQKAAKSFIDQTALNPEQRAKLEEALKTP